MGRPAGSPVILGEDVEKAIEEKIFRSNLYEEKIPGSDFLR